jgi:uncharacterized iron-regulated membrane protein
MFLDLAAGVVLWRSKEKGKTNGTLSLPRRGAQTEWGNILDDDPIEK